MTTAQNLTVGGIDVSKQVTDSIANLRSSLGGVTDVASAPAALPKLRDITTQIDRVDGLIGQMTPEQKKLLAGIVSPLMPTLNQLFDKVLAIPGVSDVLKPTIDLTKGEARDARRVTRAWLRAAAVCHGRRKYMSIITWIILGLIAGFVGAKLVNREGQGFWLDIALGIVGAYRRWISVCSVRGFRRHWFEHLQYDRCDRGRCGCAADLQRGSRSTSSVTRH